MRLVTQLPDFLRAGVFFQLAIFIAISLTRRYVISSSSIRVTLLMMVLISAFLSPVQAGDQDMSFIESTLRILTSLSAFLISESPSIVILILTDKSVISIIQVRMEKFIPVNRTPSSSLETSNYPNWSELPTDMIGEIVNRLPNFMDIKAIVAVCKSWGSACSETETTRPPPFPLMLMLSETLDDSNTRQRFFNLCDSRCYQLELSTIRGKRCWGSPHGWVIALGPDYEPHLEPLEHLDERVAPIALPPLNPIRRMAPIEEWFRLVHKFILFKESDHEFSFLVFAIFGPIHRLAFTRVGEGADLNNRRGQGEWVIVNNPNHWEFKDVARFQGQLYGLCDNGMLVRFELDDPQSARVVRHAYPPARTQDVREPQKLYLVESQENLYGVFRYGEFLEGSSNKTTGFSVFKFNFSGSNWEEVRDLGDRALFVGDSNSCCIPTLPLISVNGGSIVRSNSIFFTDDNWQRQMFAGVAYGGHDVGVFDMASGDIQPLPFDEQNRNGRSSVIQIG
uniref:KIB1-4 beta-propeller domain-containing protein n=1 Tax=Fagus sylvatica TaxID=28930 RepID=A0A2N9J6J8_FAGSY